MTDPDLLRELAVFMEDVEIFLRRRAARTNHAGTATGHAPPSIECIRCELEKHADQAGDLVARIRREEKDGLRV